MDLILKPTEACNFACTFCSSTDIQKDSPNLELEAVKRFLNRFPETRTIIINGGDPLMMKPSYYWALIKILEELEMGQTTISFTSNLWIFYQNPEPWIELFRHPRVGVGTSFQYGNKRIKKDGSVFTEDEFWKVSDLMLSETGYRPDFISVIDADNVDTVMRTVELAKAMDVTCKANPAVSSGPLTEFKGIKIGNAGKMFTLADMYAKYVEIHEAGLTQWEFNTQQMVKILTGQPTVCPQARTCDSSIRTLQPGNRYYSCGSFGDDGLYGIDFEAEMSSTKIATPLSEAPELLSLKNSCFTCPMFNVCNGCRKMTHDLKSLGLVEQHCRQMKSLAAKVIDINSLSDRIVPTEYIDETI